jgi:glycosyltransferase involved in cell wall biosynthesis
MPRAKLICQGNHGVVHARNQGVNLASGKYISIIDSDDTIPPNRTSRLVEALEGQPSAVLAYGDVSILDSSGAVKGLFSNLYPVKSGEFSDSLFLHYCFVPAASVMFRRDAFLQSGPFWGPGPHTDYLKWIELGLIGDVVRLKGEPLGGWRWHSANTSRKGGKDIVFRYQAVKDGLLQLLERHSQFRSRLKPHHIKRRLSWCHLMAGFHLGLEDWREAAQAQFLEANGIHKSLVACACCLMTHPMIWPLSRGCFQLASRIAFPGV